MSSTVENVVAQSSPTILELVPQKRSFRYQSLDFWRGVACLTVATSHYISMDPNYHSAGWPYIEDALHGILVRMWIGVPMFFVISGYCIAASAELQASKGDPWFTFFRKRARRVFPPYWIWIAVSVLIAIGFDYFLHYDYPVGLKEYPSGVKDRFLKISAIHWLGNLTLTETWLGWMCGYHFNWDNLFLAHAWTLCYEEQFYAVTGLLLLLLGRRHLMGASIVTAIVFARCCFFSPNLNSGFFFDGRWLSFAAGVAVFSEIHSRSPWSRWVARLYLAAGLAWACRAPLGLVTTPHGVEHEYFAAFAFAWLLVALYRWDDLLHNSRPLRPVRFCGSFCYSFYLVHLTVGTPMSVALFHSLRYVSTWQQAFLTTPACLACTAAVGYLFHILVERRFLSTNSNALSTTTAAAMSTSVTAHEQSQANLTIRCAAS